ncbi:MAG: prepilin-type N-terminal cleavage/methylation domain-containing protein [Candidatus Aureabacteria bacterium]|nr:prepilin-type N-terminal cleavage/methylation domain-containing protein [Candidatus Auribacterota bacterium]
MRSKGFTLIEILIVMTIIAILATILIPSIGGFDSQAKITTTTSNLNILRTQISIFRAKTGRYPETLDELAEKTYLDRGVKKKYLPKMPEELVSSDDGGNNTTEVQLSTESLSDDGGWTYFTDTAEVVIDVSTPLDKTWDEYADEKPSDW